jgi:curved DNA-binding protein CbpA
MVIREQALEILNLEADSTREDIDRAYQRMVRRYPPEFHPERFRRIDESYRTLTSLAFVVETILGDKQSCGEDNLARTLADISPAADDKTVCEGLREMRTLLLVEKLWPGGQALFP